MTTEDLRLRGVVLDRASARRVVRLDNAFVVWVLRGEQNGPRVLAEGGRVVCLAVLRRGAVIAAKCGAETVLEDAERLMIMLSGGKAGASGLRPREVLIAGVLDDPTANVELIADASRAAEAGNSGGVYWVRTRSIVQGIAIERRDGDTQVMEFDACQLC